MGGKCQLEAAQPACHSRSALWGWKVMMERRVGGLKSPQPGFVLCTLGKFAVFRSFLSAALPLRAVFYSPKCFYTSHVGLLRVLNIESLTASSRAMNGPFAAIAIPVCDKRMDEISCAFYF